MGPWSDDDGCNWGRAPSDVPARRAEHAPRRRRPTRVTVSAKAGRIVSGRQIRWLAPAHRRATFAVLRRRGGRSAVRESFVSRRGRRAAEGIHRLMRAWRASWHRRGTGVIGLGFDPASPGLARVPAGIVGYPGIEQPHSWRAPHPARSLPPAPLPHRTPPRALRLSVPSARYAFQRRLPSRSAEDTQKWWPGGSATPRQTRKLLHRSRSVGAVSVPPRRVGRGGSLRCAKGHPRGG